MTPRQSQLLRFISEELRANDGVAPTFQEMSDHLKLGSKSQVHRLLASLERARFIRRIPGRSRAIEVIRLPRVPVPRSTDPAIVAASIEARFGPVREGVLVVRLAELCAFLTAENLT